MENTRSQDSQNLELSRINNTSSTTMHLKVVFNFARTRAANYAKRAATHAPQNLAPYKHSHFRV